MGYNINLNGRVAVITGAASGIGKATALILSRAGARVALVDIDNMGEFVAKDIRRTTERDAVFFHADVSQVDDVSVMVDRVAQHFHSEIAILVNNAGIERNDRGNIVTMPLGDMQRIIDVNLMGYIYCARAIVPNMLLGIMNGAFHEGRIINVSSIQGLGAHVPGTSYQITKAGILGLTKALAVEYGPQGILTNAVAPGAIATEGMGKTRASATSVEVEAAYRRRIPLGRRGESEEVANTILFLCSDLASYVNGATVLVDGGYLADITPDELKPKSW